MLYRLVRCIAIVMALHLAQTGEGLAQGANLVELENQITQIRRETGSQTMALERQAAQNERLLEELRLSASDSNREATLKDLRQAEFEVATGRTRRLTIEHRIEEQTDRIAAINASIVRANAALGTNQRDTLERIVSEAEIDLQSALRDEHAAILERLEAYTALLTENESLRREQLSIVQDAITLDALDGYEDAASGPLIARINERVEELSVSALALSNAASAMTETNPAAQQRRNLLRLRADELLLRSSARLTDVTLVEASSVVEALETLMSETAIPTRLFEEARFALQAQSDALAVRQSTTDASALAAANFLEILSDPEQVGEGTQTLAAAVTRLAGLLEAQRGELAAARNAAAALAENLAREQATRDRSRLFTREQVGIDAASRDRISSEISTLPDKLLAMAQMRWVEIRSSVEVASARRLAAFGAAALLLLALTVVLRQKLLKDFIANQATNATEIPLEVVRRNLFWLFPIGLWAIFTQLFAVTRETAGALFPLLAIPALSALLRDLTSVIVTRKTSERQRHIGTVITRSMEVAMVLTSIVLFAYAVLAEVTLLPSTESAINRLVFSVFVLAALPMLLFVFFFAASSGPVSEYDDAPAGTSIRALVAAALSLLPPAALIATGVAGLAGYTSLATFLLTQLGTAIVIMVCLALGIGIASDAVHSIANRIRSKDPTRAYFMQANFLQPLYRLCQLSLVIAALAVAQEVFDWTGETPGIREAIAIWNARLFSVADQPYTIGSVIVALLALVLVFWFAAWSRRVAYSVLLRKVRDVGIRQSLSTFAQYVVIVFGVLLTLSAVGFDVTTLTVFAASLGVGIGFGLQNVVNNFISGILLLVERPLRIGDIVTVGGASGTVSQIGIRSMRMRTFDEFDLVVPNSQLISDTFTNWTRSNSLMRVLLTVGISYDDTPEEAIALATKVLQDHRSVVRNPSPLVTVDEFGDNSVNLRVCYYFDLMGDTSGFVIRSEILSGIRRAFYDAGISIPFPQRDLHIIEPKGARDVVALRDDQRGRAAVSDERRRGSHDVADFVETAKEDAYVDDPHS